MSGMSLVHADHELLRRKWDQVDIAKIATGVHQELVRFEQIVGIAIEASRDSQGRAWHVIKCAYFPQDLVDRYTSQKRGRDIPDQSIKGAFAVNNTGVKPFHRAPDQIRFLSRGVGGFFVFFSIWLDLESHAH